MQQGQHYLLAKVDDDTHINWKMYHKDKINKAWNWNMTNL